MTRTGLLETFGMLLGFLGIGLGYLAIYMGIRHDRLKRELEHKERMFAIERGRPLRGDLPWLTPLRASFLIGFMVPAIALGVACLATLVAGFQVTIWQIAGFTSIAALAASWGIYTSGPSREFAIHPRDVELNGKAPCADDAYDVVSSRG